MSSEIAQRLFLVVGSTSHVEHVSNLRKLCLFISYVFFNPLQVCGHSGKTTDCANTLV